MRLWSGGEKVFESWRCSPLQVELEDSLGVGVEGVSWPPRERFFFFFWRKGRDGRGTVHLAEWAPEITSTSGLAVDLFKFNGSQVTQTEAVLPWMWNLCASGRGGQSCAVIDNDCLRFLLQKVASGTSCPLTGHLPHYSHEFIKSPCLSCAIIFTMSWSEPNSRCR